MLNVRSISNAECNDDKYKLGIKAHEGHLCTINEVNEGTCGVS